MPPPVDRALTTSEVQVVAPPAAPGGMALAIRKHVVPDYSLGDYLAGGAFAQTLVAGFAVSAMRKRTEEAPVRPRPNFDGELSQEVL